MIKKKRDFLFEYYNTLNMQGVFYFVYGEYENLPNGNGSSDIDMIISPSDFNLGISILNSIARNDNVDVVSYYYGPNSCFVRFMTPEWGVQFDIISAFYHKDKIYYPTEYLRNDIVIHNDVIKVLKIEVGYYVDFLKELTHINTVKEQYVRGFVAEYSKNEVRKKQLKVLYGEELTNIIDNHLQCEAMVSVLPELKNILIKKLHPSKITLGRIKRRLFSFKRLFLPPGYVIAVLGTDGSGKSTIINEITPILNEAFHKGVIYHHLRPSWLPDLGVLSGRREKTAQHSVCTNPHSSQPSGLLGSLFRWAYYLIDYSLGYLKKIWLSKHTKSHVHIFDRYYYDYFIDPYRLRVKLPWWIIRLGEFFVPCPDIILCLGGNPNIIYERKPETTLEEVTLQNERLRHFCNRRENAVWIDTTQDVNKSVKEAMKAIHEMMAKRFANVTIK